MTMQRDPEALLSAYLVDGMEVLPDRVVDAVLHEIHRTRQRTVFGPWRSRFISRTAFAAAAVMAMLALGAVLFVVGRGPSPTPTEEPGPSLRSVVDPTSTPSAPSEGPTASPVTNPAGLWIRTGTMGTPRINHAAVRLLDGRVLVMGGERGSNGETVTSVELYDPVTGTWSATGEMLKPHEGFPATLLRDGRVLVGGIEDTTENDAISTAEVYDPESGTWTATGQMIGDGHGTATLLRNGKVLVAGLSAQLYDPDSGSWTETGRMISPRYLHTAVLLFDGRVLVAGGDVVPDIVVDSAELYDPDTGSWTAIANMRAKREPNGAFLQPDGKVLVLGSRAGGTQSAELYDPVNGAWIATGSMVAPRFDYAAASLADGRVLVVGGNENSGVLATTELYDPGTGTWTSTAPMLRSHGTPGERGTPAIPLLDGTVLVAGGQNCLAGVCVPTGAAELYVPAGVSPPPLPAFPNPPPPVIPSPTPIPTPFPPQAGPVPAGARTWKVTVVNNSSVPATLFLAEDGEDGIGHLCGSVTPNVVPAGVTENVTFLLPPKTVTGCWILVNPVPGQGASLFETSDAPIAGEVFIQEGGQGGWLSP
jgi:Kelch motif